MKSGPKELADYRRRYLEAEKKGMTPEEVEILERGQRRLAEMNMNEPNPNPPGNTPGPETQPTAPRKRRQRSDAGKPKPTPPPGMVKFNALLTASDATELLGYLIRKNMTDAAHQLVDSLARAQKEAA